jgi:ketosteroid isomerase-like protein
VKRRIVVAAFCGLATLEPFVTPAAAEDRGRAEGSGSTDRAVRRVAEDWKAAYNAKDAAAVAALYGPHVSAHVVARGRAKIQAYFRRGIDAGGHVDAIQILSSGHSGDLAYTVGTHEATNAGQQVRGRNVVVVPNVAGRWLIVAHETVVADQP